MTKLKELSLDMSEEEYRELDLISYSFLSGMSRMGPEVINDTFEGNAATNFGCLVEDLLLEPDIVSKKYYFQTNILSEGKLKDAIDLMEEYILNYDGEIFDEKVIKLFIDMQGLDIYYEKKDSEWRAKKIYNEGYEYIKALFKSKGKIKMSNEDYYLANTCADTLKNNEFSKWIFEEKAEIEVFNQFKGKSEINGVPYKFMIDRVFINHSTKTINLIDIKTGSNNEYPYDNNKSFIDSFNYWRYDIQGYLYQKGFRESILSKYYPDYTLLPFKFLYISKFNPKRCLLYQLKDNYLTFNKILNGSDKRRGLNQLLKDYEWYKSNGFEVDYPEEVYKNNGILTIEIE